MQAKVKNYAVITLVVMNIFVAGAVFGAIQGYNYAKGQTKTTEKAVQAALKNAPVAQAAPKANSR